MMDTTPLYEERKQRVLKTVALEKTDRTPVVLEYSGFGARAIGARLGDYVKDMPTATEMMIQAWDKVGGADAMEYSTYTPDMLSLSWLSKIYVPGRELPYDEAWQVQERELMTSGDYDRIAEVGWNAFMVPFLEERVGLDFAQALGGFIQFAPQALEKWKEHDAPVLVMGIITTPYEVFCGGRTLAQFVLDLYRIPDKVQAAMDVVLPEVAPMVINGNKQFGFPAMWIGGWRSASEMLSRPLWERFVWPYLEKLAYEVLASDTIVIFHLDSDWTRDLEMFKTFPAGKCVLSLDSSTDIFKAKEILGDTMCIMGDVSPVLLSHGTPDEVYDYSRRLIEGLGPTGFILHSGCDIPIDASVENVQAMIAAATGK
jgi:Uroporphyrinogen decarboxylase (URO-D)